jgi:hypothetical protein
LHAFARIHEERRAGEVSFAGGVEFGKDRDELDGEIVHAIKAHILEGPEDGALARAGESGEDNELA